MKIKLGTLKRILCEALDPNSCPDCMGSGEYVGFNSIDKCKACGGTGKKSGVFGVNKKALTVAQVKKFFSQAFATALDAGGPAGDEMDLEEGELDWWLQGDVLHAELPDSGDDCNWTLEHGWVSAKGFID